MPQTSSNKALSPALTEVDIHILTCLSDKIKSSKEKDHFTQTFYKLFTQNVE